MNHCIIVPVYNHQHAIKQVVEQLKSYDLHCILINDGSSAECTAVLKKLAQKEGAWITLYERAENAGKGAAVIDGFKIAIEKGFTHAIQIDADGQHQFDDMTAFIKASEQYPQRLIIGQPVFDQYAPKKRLYGRKFTNLWIWINTLSFSIKDGLCGFRCYPLDAISDLLKRYTPASGMDFDIDIIVHLYWQGLEVINIPTPVHYPVDGVSHFKMWSDNVLISKKHAQLFFGMIRRIAKLLIRHIR